MSALNVWTDNAWTPVDLRGPVGDRGPTGPAGVFTQPTATTFRDYVGNHSNVANGWYEPPPLTVVNSGTNPATQVSVTQNTRIESLVSGILLINMGVATSLATPVDMQWLNIRNGADQIISGGYMEYTDVECSISALCPVVPGDQFKFLFMKLVAANANISFTIRTALIT